VFPASGSAWLEFGVDQARTEAVATISSVGDDFVWGFLVGFGQVAKRQGRKNAKITQLFNKERWIFPNRGI
jgi:hypothetical protein